jgi:hypothetical protein
VKASNDRPLLFIYYGEGLARRSLARLLTRDGARRIAAGIAKLPELFGWWETPVLSTRMVNSDTALLHRCRC